MRYARLVFYVVVLLILFTFGFQNFDSLTIGVPIRFNLMGLMRLEPTPLEIWQIFLGTGFIVFAATLALDLATVLSLRADVWKKDRELRNLRARVEEQEGEIKRLRAASGGASAPVATRPAATAATTVPAPKGAAASTEKGESPASEENKPTVPAGSVPTKPSEA
ncbi:MAG: hypothetical protein KDH09_15255 [Chrysiogenetes bacterium]|nr:hypothetical protein [Chrysiogenetes bacterium]